MVFTWAELQGAKLRVEESLFENGQLRGLKATSDLQIGDKALQIPLDLIIDVQTVRSSSLVRIVQAAECLWHEPTSKACSVAFWTYLFSSILRLAE